MTEPEPTGERTLPGIRSENYWYQRHVLAYRFARRFLRGPVVDAGCGEGYGTRILGTRRAGSGRRRVVGVDLESSILSRAAGRYPDARFVAADLCRPFLAPGSAGAIVALQVLEHLRCPEDFLSAASEILRPGGVLILSTPNRATFPAGLNPSHVHEYDAGELEWLLLRHFDQVRLLGTAHGPMLRTAERVLPEPLPHRLVARRYEDQPAWLRGVLRMVRARHFRLVGDAAAGLDLLAVCGRYDPEVGPQPDVTTVHLGQFTHETANAIARQLDKAGIVWWYKEPGFFSQIWEIGIRLFVDRDRLDEAKAIAERLSRGRADPDEPGLG